MIRLSVNINKIALIRNSRGANLPDLCQVTKDLERFGAQGITVHPRPDERHIRFSDLPLLREVVKTEFNIEGYPSPYFIDQVLGCSPDQVTLVPDPPDALTSNSGWDTRNQLEFLKPIVRKFKDRGIRVSLFLNPEPELVHFAAKTGTDRIELYTGLYSAHYSNNPQAAVSHHVLTAFEAEKFKLGLNAGHDLNLTNLSYYKDQVAGLMEVSIGHALVCDALYFGLQNAVQMYLLRLSN